MYSSSSVNLDTFEGMVWPGSIESFIDQIKDGLDEEELFFLNHCPKINISVEQGSCMDGSKLVAIPNSGGSGSGHWRICYVVYLVSESDQTLSRIGSLYLGFDMYSGISQKPNTIQYSNNSGSIPV